MCSTVQDKATQAVASAPKQWHPHMNPLRPTERQCGSITYVFSASWTTYTYLMGWEYSSPRKYVGGGGGGASL